MPKRNQESEPGNSKNNLAAFGLSLSAIGTLVSIGVVISYVLHEVWRSISISSHEWFNYYCLAAILSLCGIALSMVALIWPLRRIALYGIGLGVLNELMLLIVMMDAFTRMP